jgi:hypothetical protein
MKTASKTLSLTRIREMVMLLEVLGFSLAILVSWITEWFDPPFSTSQVAVESFVILLLGAYTIHATRLLMGRIKQLEGFMVICASCKRVRIDDKWVNIEDVLASGGDLLVSHGVCPEWRLDKA